MHPGDGRVAVVDVSLDLVVTVKRSIRDLDLHEPLDPGDRIPAGHDRTQWIAMIRGQRLAVHLIREENRGFEPEATLESVGAAKDQMARLDVGAIQDF